MTNYMESAFNLLANLFLFTVGMVLLVMIILAIRDITQTKDAIRKNYPLVGRFRYLFETLGEFFRQYFFAMDREEMPFNRAEREWISNAAKDNDNTMAFGSTKTLTPVGTTIFVNCPFPTLTEDASDPVELIIGKRSPNPYQAKSFFNISGMSFGALSAPAVAALSRGAKNAGCWMNTGEGALSPYHEEGGCDIVYQIGTAKYGVRNDEGLMDDENLKRMAQKDQVKMFEIKLSQGAKPGKGGILPGVKVTEEIATIRGIAQGEDSISPNRHPEIGNIDELLDFIYRVKQVTQKPVGFKSVIGSVGWIETLCKRISERGLDYCPDFITVDSGDGGTGAAPMPLLDNVGLPIRESLPLVVDVLIKHGLRDEIAVVCSGKLITPSGVAWALAAGADFVNSARGFMLALGCIQALKCNQNTCPTGITTQRKSLQKGLDPNEKHVKVTNYHKNMVHDVEVMAHSCGVSRPRLLDRSHVRIVQQNGLSQTMDSLYPTVIPLVNVAESQ